MRRLTIVVAVAALAAVAAESAAAGCFATAGLAPPPQGIDPGQKWNAQIEVMQHGVTPLAGAKPRVSIVNEKSGVRKTFAARPTGEAGQYAATVVFPSAGSWRYEVYDGFPERQCAQTHSFEAVAVGGSPPATPPATPDAVALPEPPALPAGNDDSMSFTTGALIGAGGAALVAALAGALAFARRHRSLA